MNTVEFPGLGLKFSINRVAFEIFGLSIYWYGILIAFGFILAVLLAMRHCKKFGIEQDTILDAVLYATPVAIIFSRLYYVVFNWADFKDNPIDIINTRKGGLAIYGAVIGAILVGYIYTRIKKIGFLNLVDFCIVYFPLAQGIGRWGNFINQEAYGTHTDLPWGMDGTNIINGPVHPTFLYEFLWNMGVFFILLWYRKRKKLEGEVISLYLILYGLGRSWIELLRTDSLMIGNLRVNFMLSVVFVVIFTIVFIYRRVKLASLEMEAEGGKSVYADILKKLEEEKSESAPSAAVIGTAADTGTAAVIETTADSGTVADNSNEHDTVIDEDIGRLNGDKEVSDADENDEADTSENDETKTDTTVNGEENLDTEESPGEQNDALISNEEKKDNITNNR